MKLYLVLMSTRSLLSRTIKLYTRDEYNHASIALEEDLSDIVSFGRKNINNPFIGGFTQENIAHPFFRSATCSVYSCELTEEQYVAVKNQLDYFKANQHKLRYNLLGLIAIATRYELERQDAYFCSQFVGKVLEETSICILPKKINFLTPTDLSQLECFTLIYSGTIESYISVQMV